MDERSLRLLEFEKILDWVADRAASEPAAGKLRAWKPFADEDSLTRESRWLDEAIRRQAEPEEWCWTGPGSVEEGLEPDAREPLDGPALVRVARWLDAARRTRDAWGSSGERFPQLTARWGALGIPERLLERLVRSLEDDGRVADRASPALAGLRREAEARERKLCDHLERWSRPFGEGSYVTRANERWVVLVPAAGFSRRRGIVHDVSGSGQSLFVEPLEACEPNNQVLELRARAAEEERRILVELAEAVREHGAEVRELVADLVHLDTLRARALWAREVGARVLPVVKDGTELVLRGARHPLLLRGAVAEHVVPLDLDLRGEGRVLLVSGPNMGGKTVLLKTVGLSAALGAAGFPVPVAEGSRIPRFTTLLVELGDEQSVERGLSTFAAHLEVLGRMAERAGRDTLMLCDELGAGTDPEEGAALGQALLEHLAATGSWAVVTTHLGPLKRVAGSVPGVVNGSLEFDSEMLTPRYRFLPGIPGASHALSMAERLGFPRPLVDRARALAPESAQALERLLEELDQARNQAEERAHQAAAAQEEARAAAAGLEAERERVRASAAAARRKAAQQLEPLVARARELVEQLRREARQAERSRARALPLQQEAAALEREADALSMLPPSRAEGSSPPEIVPGARLRVLDLNVEAEVVSPPDSEGKVELRRGAWRIQSHRSRLAPAETSDPSVKVPAWSAEPAEATLELDLRGMDSEEALRALDSALDRAVRAGLREIRLIHGIGKGVLRAAVAAHLRDHPQVASHRMGSVGEGGRGVTLVELQ